MRRMIEQYVQTPRLVVEIQPAWRCLQEGVAVSRVRLWHSIWGWRRFVTTIVEVRECAHPRVREEPGRGLPGRGQTCRAWLRSPA